MNRLEGAAAVSAHPREHANAEIAELETDSSLSLSALNALSRHISHQSNRVDKFNILP